MLPLQNRRILVTRPRDSTSTFDEQLRALGATPIVIPTIQLDPPISFAALDAALRDLHSFSLVVFTSANAVQAFAARAALLGISPNPRQIAVIGPATASAVHATGIVPDDPILLTPPRYVAESLLELLLPHAPGARIFLPRADAARDLLAASLAAAGANVTTADAYRTVIPEQSVGELATLFATHPPDAVTFTSASTAENLVRLLRTAGLALPPQIIRASIGPITSGAMRELGIEPHLEASNSTIPALVDALAAHFATLPSID